MPSPTCTAKLEQHRADLSEALLKLREAGLNDWPAAHMCRRYLAKVKHWIADPRAADVMLAIYAPGIRDALLDAEFELSRLTDVHVLSPTSICVAPDWPAPLTAGICKGAVA